MPQHLARLLHPILQSGRDLAPVLLIIAFFQLIVVQEPIPDIAEKLLGALFVLVGLTLFLAGLSMSLFPLGERLADEFAQRSNI
jgi:hypothetical protein